MKRFKTIKDYFYIMAIFLLFAPLLQANERPLARDFADEIGQHWANLEFEDLELRVNTVYAAHPDFIPAIIAKAFVDGVFQGKIYDARDKVLIVSEFVDQNPEEFEERFLLGVHGLLAMTNREIKRQEAAGRTPEELEEHASPAAVREAFGHVLIPFIRVLVYAPDEEISPEPQ